MKSVTPHPKVAVLLATYNGEAFLAPQLASLLAQVEVEVHIIVRDDGSSDGSLACVLAFQERFPAQISIVREDGYQGGSAGRSFIALLRGLSADAFDFVALCDQDDIWAPNKIETAIRHMRDTASGGYSSDLIAFDQAKRKSWVVRKSGTQRRLDYLFQSASAGCTYVLDQRTTILLQGALGRITASPPPGLSHDFAIYAICRSQQVRWFMDESAYIFYRQHASNVFSALPGVGGLLAKLKLSRGGWYRENLGYVAALLVDDADAATILQRLLRLNVADRLWLARHCPEFRRRRRDQLFLAVTILLGLI
jgi:rhamnosyltransferase